MNKRFCYVIINMWEECRFYFHVTFFTTQPFSNLDLFRAIFLHIVTVILQSCPFTLVLLYQQYNCSVLSRRLHDMTSVVLALWRHLHVLLQIDCFLSHRHSRTELHCIAGFICPPWVVTDLAIAFHCVFWSSVKFTSKFVRLCRLFTDSGFEYPACAIGLFNYDSLYTDSISKIIESRSMRWVEHVAGMGEKRNAYRVLVRRTEGEKYLEDIASDWRVILTL